MNRYITLPGYGNSDEKHWQTYFESKLPNSSRIQQESWEKPECSSWVNNIDEHVKNGDIKNSIVITHSMGGIALAHWAVKFHRKIKGALIVAPPDLENPYKDYKLESFTPIPLQRLPFPSILVCSSNDHWASVERSAFFAEAWGSKLVTLKNAGHKG